MCRNRRSWVDATLLELLQKAWQKGSWVACGDAGKARKKPSRKFEKLAIPGFVGFVGYVTDQKYAHHNP